jgi:transcriptional regulator with XRE-family HTH domain
MQDSNTFDKNPDLSKPLSNNPQHTFGQRLKKWREQQNVSGWQIEKVTGIPRQNLSQIESGKRGPSEDVLEKLASIQELNLDINTMKAWLAIDAYGQDVLLQALSVLQNTDPSESISSIKG